MPFPGLKGQNGVDPHAEPTPSFTHVGNREIFYLYSKPRQLTFFFLSQQWHRCHDFLGRMLTKVVEKSKKLQYMSLEKMPILPVPDSGSTTLFVAVSVADP
jgi:hypothetical protein